MGFFDVMKTYFNKPDGTTLRQAMMLGGKIPVYSQFGSDVYASDIMQQCMGCITEEMRKVRLNHIKIKDGKEQIENSKLNRLLEYGVNEFMTTSDFLEKATYNLLKNMNSFIYPLFTDYTDTTGRVIRREVEGLYPLSPKRVLYKQDESGRLFVRLEFISGDAFTLPYDNLIHWRMRYSENEYMGGNVYGEAEVEDLLKTVQINDDLQQGLSKSVAVSQNKVGLLQYPLAVGAEEKAADKKEFEKLLRDKDSLIIQADARATYTPLNVDPKLIDKDTLEFIDSKILRHWGCSLPVLNGTATPQQQQAFYQRTLEPKIISLAQAMTKTLFTSMEYSTGNRIKIYPEELIFLDTQQKLSFATLMADRGALTNNQLLGIFGLPPYEGGDVRYMSLNFCDVEIANKYQLNRAGAEKGAGNESK